MGCSIARHQIPLNPLLRKGEVVPSLPKGVRGIWQSYRGCPIISSKLIQKVRTCGFRVDLI
jgi:hypothetical protein